MGPLDRANLNHWTDKPEEEVIDSSSTDTVCVRIYSPIVDFARSFNGMICRIAKQRYIDHAN
jgi:hypothetical protein